MKTAIRMIVGLLAAAALMVPTAWWYLIHYERTIGLPEQNLGLFIWSVIGVSVVSITGLTALFYRSVR